MITTGSTRGWCSVRHAGQRRITPPSAGSVAAPQFAQNRWPRCQFNSAAAYAARPPSACGSSSAALRSPTRPSTSGAGSPRRPPAPTSVGRASPAGGGSSSTAKTGPSPSSPSSTGASGTATSASGCRTSRPPSMARPPLPTTSARACGCASCSASHASSRLRPSSARSSATPVKVLGSREMTPARSRRAWAPRRRAARAQGRPCVRTGPAPRRPPRGNGSPRWDCSP